jgi:hypothetical protein
MPKLSDRQIRNLVELSLGNVAPVDNEATALCVLLKQLSQTTDAAGREHIFEVASDYAFRRTTTYGNAFHSFVETKPLSDSGL